MKFCWTSLNVKNLEESLRFYQEIVGLPLKRRFVSRPGVEIAFLGEGETEVELIFSEEIKDVNLGRDISLGFEVKSVDEKIEFLKEKGITDIIGPLSPNPHIRFFFIKDPNGLKIQFVENM